MGGDHQMNIETYIRQLEDAKKRGNKVTSIDSAIAFARSMRRQTREVMPRIDFLSDSELLGATGGYNAYNRS